MARARRMGSSSSITRTLLTLPAPGLRPGRSGPARCARSRFPLLAYGRAARAPLAALAHASRSWPTAGPLGPRSLRSLTLPAPGLRPGRSGPARCARSRAPDHGAAVDGDRHARDPAGGVAAEEHSRVPHVLGLAQAPQRQVTGDGVAVVLPQGPGEV